MERKLIFDKDRGCRNSSYITPSLDIKPEEIFGGDMLREDLSLPDISESEVVRHYMQLARLNFSVDTNFYPLGSCTMKYNPKINEYLSGLEGFSRIHPLQREDDLQGALELMYEFQNLLCALTGMKAFAFQPSSGAQGELTGILMVRSFHEINGSKKSKVIVPDSAHGTNPATATMCGYETVVIESRDGLVDIHQLEKSFDEDVAALMLTNPNTLGLFEKDILKISRIVHERGGLLYYDGANFNPLMGIAKPALMGFDIIHLNLHKTFSTPHGCGGPGAGIVGAVEPLEEFLPLPRIKKRNKTFYLDYGSEKSLGSPRTFFGNFDVLVKAYAYILRLGREGLKRAAQNSVLNANYIKKKLEKYYQPAYSKQCMHEVVFSCSEQKKRGASALDIAKRLIDYRIHPPTMYFPLIVKEALMVEPTETENKEMLDYFIRAMIKIDEDTEKNPQKLKSSPHKAAVGRVDETRAARMPVLAHTGCGKHKKSQKT
ncbi:MAG: aminotransferase class V-fold PLP-dependent enzyme [Candidatus Omnitrophica bacterium]|nr:aminotransferase class V-fold PLP-dependent enzyme [Candidatus Omnitrophota bacterium]MBD3269279.1 aminotransferase class V-fold PLP-dependent enzyme [Candidatus Omnitrophota bacterium]